MTEQKQASDLRRAFTEDGAWKTHVGGQALLEGVMMRGRYNWSAAVRTPNGDIYTEEHDLISGKDKHAWMRVPVIRGCVAFFESLVLGYKALDVAAERAYDADGYTFFNMHEKAEDIRKAEEKAARKAARKGKTKGEGAADAPSSAQTVLSSHGQSTGLSGSCGTRREGAPAPLPLAVAAIVLLTCAVAVRAVGGAAVAFPWKVGAGAAFAMTACVFAGKALGGFVCDRLGPARTAWISIPVAAVCIAFFAASMPLSLVGQFALNLTMPVTLWLLYRLMPEDPAFAFGLAASALWPGTIAGLLLTLTGPALWACVVVSFIFGLVAILYGANRLPKEEGGKRG